MKFSLLSYKMPQISGTQYGCFSKIPKHPPTEGKVLYRTSYMDGFCKRFEDKNFLPLSGKMLNGDNIYSGLKSDYESRDRKFIISALTSENYNRSPERKYNTQIQRTWINYKDPSIQAVENRKVDTSGRRPWANEIKFMSLPMFNKQEYQQLQRYSFNGCGHKISDITRKKLEEMAKLKKIKEGVA